MAKINVCGEGVIVDLLSTLASRFWLNLSVRGWGNAVWLNFSFHLWDVGVKMIIFEDVTANYDKLCRTELRNSIWNDIKIVSDLKIWSVEYTLSPLQIIFLCFFVETYTIAIDDRESWVWALFRLNKIKKSVDALHLLKNQIDEYERKMEEFGGKNYNKKTGREKVKMRMLEIELFVTWFCWIV